MEFKAAKCPSCGGNLQLPNDLQKAKCLYCGTEIIVSDAIRKVQVDNIASAENLLVLAKEAQKSSNYKSAIEYYNRYLELDIKSHEAWFGRAISIGRSSTYSDFRIIEMIQGLNKAIELAPEEKKKELRIKAADDINNVCKAFFHLSYEHFLNYIDLDTYRNFMEETGNIAKIGVIASEFDPNNIEAHKLRVEITLAIMKTYNQTSGGGTVFLHREGTETARQMIIEAEKEIKKIDPSYVSRLPEEDHGIRLPGGNSSACYIATAVYKSYDCPEVWTLRRFRDCILNKSLYGRTFIKIYYFISPMIVKLFSRYKWFNILWKKWLDKMVNKLKLSGVDDSPYQDE